MSSPKTSIIWVRVLDALPDPDTSVLIASDYRAVFVAEYDGATFRFAGGVLCHDVITHWAHLPPAPGAH